MNSASTRFGEGEFVVRATSKYTSVAVSTSHRAPETLDKIWSRCALLHSVLAYIRFTPAPLVHWSSRHKGNTEPVALLGLFSSYFSFDGLIVQIKFNKQCGCLSGSYGEKSYTSCWWHHTTIRKKMNDWYTKKAQVFSLEGSFKKKKKIPFHFF